jgi:carbon-monoxide dehydrogenase large subunit
VTIERYSAVDDVGKALNETICEGQIMGGLAQGIGQAMLEEIVYDSDGNLVTGSLLDYLLPTTTDVPRFDLELAEIPCTTNPLGVKGVGESGTIGAPPTVINAILDALRPLGVSDLSMPASPMRVWQAIETARDEGN